MVLRLRPREIGDIGWAVQRQTEIYATEFGYSAKFEEYLIQSFGPFVANFDSRRDRLWVADLDGAAVGCIAIHHDPQRAGWCKLRWFFVESNARGKGVGRQLMQQALEFSREAGYVGVWLSTVDDLKAAKRQYVHFGFEQGETKTEPCAWAPWGHEEIWELKL